MENQFQKKSSISSVNSGFTLMELLVIIVLIGILAIGAWVAIDPQDKIRSSNDSKTQTQLESLTQAEMLFSTYTRGSYTNGVTDQEDLLRKGDLREHLVPPTGYDFHFIVPEDCVTSGSPECNSIVICTPMHSKKYRSTTEGEQKVRIFSSVSGKICDFDNGSNGCIGLLSTQACP